MTRDVRFDRCMTARRPAVRLSSGCQAGNYLHGGGARTTKRHGERFHVTRRSAAGRLQDLALEHPATGRPEGRSCIEWVCDCMSRTGSSVRRSEQRGTVAPRSPTQMMRAVSSRWRSMANLREPPAASVLKISDGANEPRDSLLLPCPGDHFFHHAPATADQVIENDEVASDFARSLGMHRG
jgi:hypothetical protein